MTGARILRVSEIFESVQGEGASAGLSSIFLRLATCNLRCTWCDTKYTWDWSAFSYEREVHPMSVADVAGRLAASAVRRLVVTGGEPLLQRREIAQLLAELPREFHVEVETNGTVAPEVLLTARVDQWNVSPKLGNSGEPAPRRLKPDVLRSFRDTGRAYLKLVAESEADAEEIDALVRQLEWPKEKVLIMPQASTRAALAARSPSVAALAEKLGLKVSPRLHIERWDGKRGV